MFQYGVSSTHHIQLLLTHPSATFLVVYIGFAATNMTIFQKNRRRGYKFIPQVMLFGFCMARISTLVLRIAWANEHANSGLAIAANILVNAGILIVYILNLLFAQRILRAERPEVGWNTAVRFAFKVLYAMLVGILAMVSFLIALFRVGPVILTRSGHYSCCDLIQYQRQAYLTDHQRCSTNSNHSLDGIHTSAIVYSCICAGCWKVEDK